MGCGSVARSNRWPTDGSRAPQSDRNELVQGFRESRGFNYSSVPRPEVKHWQIDCRESKNLAIYHERTSSCVTAASESHSLFIDSVAFIIRATLTSECAPTLHHLLLRGVAGQNWAKMSPQVSLQGLMRSCGKKGVGAYMLPGLYNELCFARNSSKDCGGAHNGRSYHCLKLLLDPTVDLRYMTVGNQRRRTRP